LRRGGRLLGRCILCAREGGNKKKDCDKRIQGVSGELAKTHEPRCLHYFGRIVLNQGTGYRVQGIGRGGQGTGNREQKNGGRIAESSEMRKDAVSAD
jgi:hypothetical protein